MVLVTLGRIGDFIPFNIMKNGYYNVDITLSRNRLFNFVVGPRGVGKTYSSKMRAIKNYINKEDQFVYLLRYDTELKNSEMSKFFDDIAPAFRDHEFISGGGCFRIDGRKAGWYFPLSKSQLYKSVPFPNVSLIIFDEFIIDTGAYRYLDKEVTTFLEAYSTISRDRDVNVLFLSNAITFTNPYFLYFDLSLEKGQKVKLLEDISLELVESPDFTNRMNNTRFGRLVAGTAYGKYAYENQFLRDTDTFLSKLPASARYLATVYFETDVIGVYKSDAENAIYISEKIDNTCKIKIAADKSAHNSTTVYAGRLNYIIKAIEEYFMMGSIRFETIKCKNLTYQMMKGRL